MRDEITVFFPDFDRPVQVVMFDTLQHFFDDLRLAAAALARDEEETLQRRGRGHDRAEKQRPHDRPALEKDLYHGLIWFVEELRRRRTQLPNLFSVQNMKLTEPKKPRRSP